MLKKPLADFITSSEDRVYTNDILNTRDKFVEKKHSFPLMGMLYGKNHDSKWQNVATGWLYLPVDEVLQSILSTSAL